MRYCLTKQRLITGDQTNCLIWQPLKQYPVTVETVPGNRLGWKQGILCEELSSMINDGTTCIPHAYELILCQLYFPRIYVLLKKAVTCRICCHQEALGPCIFNLKAWVSAVDGYHHELSQVWKWLSHTCGVDSKYHSWPFQIFLSFPKVAFIIC